MMLLTNTTNDKLIPKVEGGRGGQIQIQNLGKYIKVPGDHVERLHIRLTSGQELGLYL